MSLTTKKLGPNWWILGYGDQVQVLAPEALRKKNVETAKNMIALNEKIQLTPNHKNPV